MARPPGRRRSRDLPPRPRAPRAELGRAHRADREHHVRVAQAAVLRAVAAQVVAGREDEPEAPGRARPGVLLVLDRRHPEGVRDVLCAERDLDGLVRRDVEDRRRRGGRAVDDAGQRRIGELPAPLVGEHVDAEPDCVVVLGLARVGGEGHGHEPGDDERDDGRDADLEQVVVLRRPRRAVAARPVAKDGERERQPDDRQHRAADRQVDRVDAGELVLGPNHRAYFPARPSGQPAIVFKRTTASGPASPRSIGAGSQPSRTAACPRPGAGGVFTWCWPLRAGRVGGQPIPSELLARLDEREVGRRQDDLGGLEVVVVERLALGAHHVQELLERRVEGVLVAAIDGGDGRVVELVEPRVVAVVESVLALVRDPDDHAGPPSGSCLAWSPSPVPSSAFILASSSSSSLEELSWASWRSMSSWPGPSAVRSSNVPAASSSETASARARICSVLSVARCMARPTSAICSPTPVAASEIRTCASAAEYWALMTSFFVRKASIFWRSFASESISFCCWPSSSATCWSSDCSSVCATFLRSSAVRASSSFPAASAWRACVSSLTTDCSSFCDCICRRFFAVTTSAIPFLTFCSDSSCFW